MSDTVDSQDGMSEHSFEQIMTRLESVANELENGEVRLEKALELFEEGVRLSREGTKRLDHAEHKIEMLMGDGQVKAFDAEEAS